MINNYIDNVSILDFAYCNLLHDENTELEQAVVSNDSNNIEKTESNKTTIIFIGIFVAIIVIAIIYHILTRPIGDMKYVEICDKYGYESKQCEEYLRKKAKKSESDAEIYKNYMSCKKAGMLENIPDDAIHNYQGGEY